VSTFSPAQALIAAMITPALLILGSASLIATALVRLARVVDRVRKLAEMSTADEPAAELERSGRRANLALAAVAAFFAAIVIFVVSGIAIAVDRADGNQLSWLPVGLSLFGMVLIVAGAGFMLIECGYSSAQLHAEIKTLRGRPRDTDGIVRSASRGGLSPQEGHELLRDR